jgi:pimeloyl-[acyl-carrier protein] methyl ester esterase
MTPSRTQLIAMHGWAGDQRSWGPWRALAEARGWSMQVGERGYGALPPQTPNWLDNDDAPTAAPAGARVVLAHSLGPHLLPAALWQRASAVVLLASFGAFVPAGAPGRRLKQALQAMSAKIETGQTETLLQEFFARVAAPHPSSLLPAGPLQQGISAEGRQRLLADLTLLGRTEGLPLGFPSDRPVLLVEAMDDQIVAEGSRRALRESLPQADCWSLQQAGHALLVEGLPAAVLDWVEHVQP